MNGITVIDIVIAVLGLYFIVRGFERGFIDQTSKILGLLIALYIAIQQYQYFQVYLEPYLDLPSPLMQFISFAVIFIVFNIVVYILGNVLKQIIRFLFLKPLDHLAGGVLGLIKGGIVVYLLVFLLNEIPYPGLVDMLDSSYLATNLMEITPLIQENLDNIFNQG